LTESAAISPMKRAANRRFIFCSLSRMKRVANRSFHFLVAFQGALESR
jgi:hypothetical protein